jgi:hypothetical protein
MALPGRSFEHYACRLNCLILSALLLARILQGRGLIFVLVAVALARTAFLGFDFVRSSQWWTSVVMFGLLGAGLLWTLPGARQEPLPARLSHVLATAAVLAQFTLFLGGRWRRVWGFVRPRPRGSRLSLAGRGNVGNTSTDA